MESNSSKTDFLSRDFDPRAALQEENIQLPYPECQEFSGLDELRKAVHGHTFNITREIEGVYGIGGIPFPPVAKVRRETRNFDPEQGLLKGRQKRVRNVLQRMDDMVGPLAILRTCRDNGTRVKVYTRNHSDIRSVMTASVIAFDKHWNLVLRDVHEIFIRRGKGKTPVLEDDVSHYVKVADLTIAGDDDDDDDDDDDVDDDPATRGSLDRRKETLTMALGGGPGTASHSPRTRPSETSAQGRGRIARHSVVTMDTTSAGGTDDNDGGSTGSSKRSRSGSRRLDEHGRQGRDAVSLRRAHRRRQEGTDRGDASEDKMWDSKRKGEEAEEEEKGEGKKEEDTRKKRRRRRNVPQLRERFVNTLFVRGANVVLVAFAHPATGDTDDGDEGAAAVPPSQQQPTPFSREMLPGPSSLAAQQRGRQLPS